MRELRALTFLTWLTLRRQARSRKTLVAGVLVLLLTLGAVVWGQRQVAKGITDPNELLASFSQRIVLTLFASFFLPMLSLIYAAGAFADEREQRTLIYLLIRPLERYRIYLAKAIGALPLVLGATVGGFALICLAAGPTGRLALALYWPAVLHGALAYAALFLLFGAVLPRPMTLGVAYAFFAETMVGNMPGTLKRAAVSFHARCMMLDAGSPFGVEAPPRLQFLPISGDAAMWTLRIAAVLLIIIGALLFHRKEHGDLA